MNAPQPVLAAAVKTLNALARVPPAGRLLDRPAIRRRRERLWLAYVRGLPDRRYFEREILPRLCRAAPPRLLFVGCAPYTVSYLAPMLDAGIGLRTLDIAGENAPWGAPGRHVTGDARETDRLFGAAAFDAILLNGVFGYGVNDPAGMNAALRALRRALEPGGRLLVGWNRGLVPDPLELAACGEGFLHEPAFGLPDRKMFTRSTHVYDWFRARPAESGPQGSPQTAPGNPGRRTA